MAIEEDDTPIPACDVRLLVRHIAARLGVQAPDDAIAAFEETLALGEVHERLVAIFGQPGWTALVQSWHEAAGIGPTAKRPERTERLSERRGGRRGEFPQW
jgi:hypothetical protein